LDLILNKHCPGVKGSQGSSVSIQTKLQAQRPGFSSQQGRPDWLWGQPSLLFNGYQGFLSQGYS